MAVGGTGMICTANYTVRSVVLCGASRSRASRDATEGRQGGGGEGRRRPGEGTTFRAGGGGNRRRRRGGSDRVSLGVIWALVAGPQVWGP